MTPEELRAAREAYPLTIKELARLIGVSAQAVRSWEHARRRPRPAQVRTLRDFFERPRPSQIGCGGSVACSCRCHAQGRRAWQAGEDAFLIRAAASGSSASDIAALLAEKFGQERTGSAVIQRASRLGASFRVGWYSENDVARRLGVHPRWTRMWREAGMLPAARHIDSVRGRPSKWWRIELADLEAFVDRHAGVLVDPARIRDPGLRERAEVAVVNRRAG